MRRLHRLYSRFTPWVLLCAFLAAALGFFSVAAGPDALLLPGGLSLSGLWAERPAPGEVRRAVTRMRLAEQEAERWLMDHTGKALEAEARRLEARGRRLEEAAAAGEAGEDPGPAVLVSHRFREADGVFTAAFGATGHPAEGRSYFLRAPARWVVEMDGHWRNDSPRLSAVNGHLVSRVSIDAHETLLRIVFHLTDKNAAQGPALVLEQGTDGFTATIRRPR